MIAATARLSASSLAISGLSSEWRRGAKSGDVKAHNYLAAIHQAKEANALIN